MAQLEVVAYLRFIVDLEAGKPTIQLGKVLKVITTLGCDIQINLPASRP